MRQRNRDVFELSFNSKEYMHTDKFENFKTIKTPSLFTFAILELREGEFDI